MIREIFKMLNQYAVDNPTLLVNQCFSHLSKNPGGMLSRSLGMPSRNDERPSIWDTHGFSGNVFADPVASSSAPFPQELNPWSSGRAEPFTHQRRRRMRMKHQFKIRDASPDRQPEIHSSLVREDFQRIMGQTNNDCRFRIFTLTNSLRQQPLLAGRYDSRLRYVLVHNFLRKLCCGQRSGDG